MGWLASCLKNFMGLALVHFQKYWLLSKIDTYEKWLPDVWLTTAWWLHNIFVYHYPTTVDSTLNTDNKKLRNYEAARSLKMRFQRGFEPIAFALQWTWGDYRVHVKKNIKLKFGTRLLYIFHKADSVTLIHFSKWFVLLELINWLIMNGFLKI